MKTIERYDLVRTDDRYDGYEMMETHNGDYIKYDDVSDMLSLFEKSLMVLESSVLNRTEDSIKASKDVIMNFIQIKRWMNLN